MRKPAFIFLVISSFVSFSQKVVVNTPTLEEEMNYIWRNLEDILFFEKNNYQVAFPKLQLLESLKEKAQKGELSSHDFEQLKSDFKDSVYHVNDYQKGLLKVSQSLPILQQMLDQIQQLKLNWPFQLHPQYCVRLTLYGPGGSYDPSSGEIILYTTLSGDFKQYENPANTIIHEIVHMGIEQSIIAKHQVPHAMKERIVDHFVLLNFKDLLPGYRLQEMGDRRVDPIMKASELKNLDQNIERILSE